MVGLSSGRGIRPSGWTSSSSPGRLRLFFGDLSLSSLTSFRRPFFFVSESLSPLNFVFGIGLVRKGLTLLDLEGFESPTFRLPCQRWTTCRTHLNLPLMCVKGSGIIFVA